MIGRLSLPIPGLRQTAQEAYSENSLKFSFTPKDLSKCLPVSPRDRLDRLKFRKTKNIVEEEQKTDCYVSSGQSQTQELQEKIERTVEMCLLHSVPADLICLTDKDIICAKCAIFGSHKGHDIENLDGLTEKLTDLTETLLPIYEELKNTELQTGQQKSRQLWGQRALEHKSHIAQQISSKIDSAIEQLRRVEKISLLKLQTYYKNQLKKINQTSFVCPLKQELTAWYKQIEHLPTILEEATSLKSFSEGIQYIDESEGGFKLQEKGYGLLTEIQELIDTKKIDMQALIASVTFSFSLQLETAIGNFCQVSQGKAVQTPIKSSDQKPSSKASSTKMNLPCTLKQEQKTQSNKRKLEEQDCLLLSVDHTVSSFPGSFDSHDSNVERLPNLTISHIKMLDQSEIQGISSSQSRERSIFKCVVNNPPAECYKRKKKEKMDIPEKYRAIVDDLKNDRADTVDLGGAELGDATILALCEYIRKSRKLRVLKLIRNKISDKIVGEIVAACNEGRICSLNLSQNMLTDKAVVTIEQATFQRMKSITLSLNKINRRNVKEYIESLGKKGVTLSI